MRKALVVGGNSGIGLALSLNLLKKGFDFVYIVGKELPKQKDIPSEFVDMFNTKTQAVKWNVFSGDYSVFDEIRDIDTLCITCGFGRVAHFEDLHEKEVENLIDCNMVAVIKVIQKYYSLISSENDFYTLVMGSIAGHVTSPLFSVYGASKMGLCGFIENINSELCATGKKNRVLDVSPGNVKHTGFGGGENDVSQILDLTEHMLQMAWERQTLFIPAYNEIYKGVIERYQNDAIGYGVESYRYKMRSGRVSQKVQLTVGYLSGTFDLFHVGHLNLLKRAKAECDYLIVGVHKDGSWKGKPTFIPYEDRVAILQSCKFVDKVVPSFAEDSQAYDAFKIDKLFVGSDYKGTDRFNRYEEYFKDKNVEIIYFPYTQKVSSSKLREEISSKK